MKLENLTPEIDVKHVKITQPDINRPALQLAGYFEHFDATRLQIIGFVEYTYMEGLTDETRREAYEKLMAYDIPCIVFSRDLKPDPISWRQRSNMKFLYYLPRNLLRILCQRSSAG